MGGDERATQHPGNPGRPGRPGQPGRPGPPRLRRYPDRRRALLAYDRAHVWHPYSSAPTPRTPYLVESAAGVGCGCGRAASPARSSTRCPRGGARSTATPCPSWTRPPRPAGPDEPRDVRRADARAGDSAGPPAGRLAPGGAAARLLLRLGLGLGRGRAQDGLAAARAAGRPRRRMSRCAAATTATRSPPMSVYDPVNGMHPLFTGAARAALRAATARRRRPRRTTTRSWSPGSARPGRCTPSTPPRSQPWCVEPVLQGAGGMHFYSPHVVRVLRELAREHGALVIFDEIATGFGRTGRSARPTAAASCRTSCASARP